MKRVKGFSRIILITLLTAGAIVLLVWFTARNESGDPGTYLSPTFFAMDTTLDITIQERDGSQARRDAEACLALAREIEESVSLFKKGSDVRRVNDSAGLAPVAVKPCTLEMVNRSLEYSALTGGAFDITVTPLMELWGFYNKRYRVPSREEIEARLPLVDYRKVAVDPASSTVMLEEKGMKIDLGGLAKGYAVEAMTGLLRKRGVKHALVNFGGAVGAVGTRADGERWVIGIRNPRSAAGELAGTFQLADGFVNSSGDYERYFTRGGERYCHILDPHTGYPPRVSMAATVVGPDSLVDDILSTSLFVMGPGDGIALLRRQSAYQGLVIDADRKPHYTSGMKSEYGLQLEVP